MKALAGILVMALVAAPAMGATYSWEDGGTILGWYGNLVDPTNVTGSQAGSGGGAGPYTCPGANSGDRYLHVAEDPHSGLNRRRRHQRQLLRLRRHSGFEPFVAHLGTLHRYRRHY